ncbi:hypothetical protein V493_01446 [Pseudogymnoascus sp. VKM F-4281 (FW-2241)]|nr:hypothetical protein V493_01446 [Pseudogymnoascus sp. VKM F-4281 (FW-2241)]
MTTRVGAAVLYSAAPVVRPPLATATGIGSEVFPQWLGMGSRRSTWSSVVATAEEAVREMVERREADAAFLHALRNSLPAGLGERVAFLEGEGGQAEVSAAKGDVGGLGDLVVVGRGLGGEGEVGRVLGGLAEVGPFAISFEIAKSTPKEVRAIDLQGGCQAHASEQKSWLALELAICFSQVALLGH